MSGEIKVFDRPSGIRLNAAENSLLIWSGDQAFEIAMTAESSIDLALALFEFARNMISKNPALKKGVPDPLSSREEAMN